MIISREEAKIMAKSFILKIGVIMMDSNKYNEYLTVRKIILNLFSNFSLN
jgi:hypothetical protein